MEGGGGITLKHPLNRMPKKVTKTHIYRLIKTCHRTQTPTITSEDIGETSQVLIT